MNKNIFLTFLILILSALNVNAHIDIVYPTSKQMTLNADSIFISGNTTKNSIVEINSVPVKLWEDSFFVHVQKLDYGTNKIEIKSVHDGVCEKQVLKIKRNRLSKNNKSKSKSEYIKNLEGVLYAKTINERSTVRDSYKKNSKRVVDLQKDVVLYLDGRIGDYYKIQEEGKTEFWIHKSNITEPVVVAKRIEPTIKNQKQFSDDLYDYQKFYLTYPVFYTFEQKDNSINLTLYGIKDINNPKSNNYTYCYEFANPVLGYEFYYEDNSLVLKKAKFIDDVDRENLLKGLNIFIDAGHGGKEKGTIGPSRVFEKDITLDISKKLIDLLKQAGANVTYSRIDDRHVDLYERVKTAKENNALISLSIHCNSLPYNKNPYEISGAEAHYYNENAKLLAEIIKFNLANDLSIKDNGIHKSSFVLTRSTNPVSVLVEVAYMINPNEYIFLKNEQFRKNVAKSIKKSIEEYILILSK